jgi:hypothetical protein
MVEPGSIEMLPESRMNARFRPSRSSELPGKLPGQEIGLHRRERTVQRGALPCFRVGAGRAGVFFSARNRGNPGSGAFFVQADLHILLGRLWHHQAAWASVTAPPGAASFIRAGTAADLRAWSTTAQQLCARWRTPHAFVRAHSAAAVPSSENQVPTTNPTGCRL